jgi:hypothetical protein
VEQLRATGSPLKAAPQQNDDEAPDALGPPPTLESLRGRRQLGVPSLRLMLAVLDDALETLVSGARVRPLLWSDTVAWVLSEDVRWPFSFLNICDALDLDPPQLRRRVTPWLSPPACYPAQSPH